MSACPENLADAKSVAWDYAETLALLYGIPTFPCRRQAEIINGEEYGEKSPYTKHGFKDASADADQLERWRNQHPEALIAFPTGPESGFWILDIDPDAHDWYEEHRNALACSRTVRTKRGLHLYYRATDAERDITTSPGDLPKGADVRGRGGYVIAWDAHGQPVEGVALYELTAAPEWLLAKIRAKKREKPARTMPPAASALDGDNFFRRVNDAALQNLGAWFPELFPDARESNQGWRVSSAALGRELEEDISATSEGIQDFGEEHGCTAIDLAITWLEPRPDVVTAALWLCTQMQIEPTALGWKPPARAVDVQSLDLRITKQGVIADEENIYRILMRLPYVQGIVRFDEFKNEMILARPITDDPALIAERGTPRAWRDSDTVELQTFLQRFIVPRIGRDKIEAVVAMVARKHCAFHPIRTYLQSLSWDGVLRLDALLHDYFGADEQPAEYLAAVGARWMISAVARIMNPGCQVDSAIVLEGAQGIFKSTALRTLAGDAYFSDSLPADLSEKDAMSHLHGNWIIELSELPQFKRGEIETVKAFISRRFDKYRPSYGRHDIYAPRQNVFAGTTNADSYLVDSTGNRRFWPAKCKHVDVEALKRDRDQLWAEALTRFRAGEPWHLTGDLVATAAQEAAARVAHDPWTPLVEEAIASELCTPTSVTPGEVMELMSLPKSDRHTNNAARVGQILRDLGWRKGKRDRTRGQVYERTA